MVVALGLSITIEIIIAYCGHNIVALVDMVTDRQVPEGMYLVKNKRKKKWKKKQNQNITRH